MSPFLSKCVAKWSHKCCFGSGDWSRNFGNDFFKFKKIVTLYNTVSGYIGSEVTKSLIIFSSELHKKI
jgi:hypothetical protein